MPVSPTLIASLAWILLTLLAAAGLIRQDLTRIGQQQDRLLNAIESELHARLQQSHTLLRQVADRATAAGLFDPRLRSELETLRRLTPGVRRIQLQRRVKDDAIGAFEQQMRQRYPDFLLHGLTAMTPPARERSGTTLFHPLLLVVPDTPAAQAPPLGTDMGLIPALRHALLDAHREQRITYSGLYNQDRTPQLNLFLASPHDRDLIASLVIELGRLLPPHLLPTRDRLQLSLPHQQSTLTLTEGSAEPALLRQQRQRDSRLGDLPIRLQLTTPLGWQDLGRWPLLLSLGLATLGCLFLRAWLLQRRLAASCHLESAEVFRLQHHLQQHSAQLQQQLQENQRLTHRILDIQERERRHLAQELHDELGQCLTAIRTDARLLLQDYPDPGHSVNRHAESIDAIAGHIYDVTYDLMHALRPTLLDDLGLVDALRELIRGQHLERQGITLELTLKGALNDMEERFNINLYRMIQEALTNLQRHAGCSQARLSLQRLEADSDHDRILLEIGDNGCGFDARAISHKGRFGLLGIQARVKALNGQFDLDTAPGQGTRLRIRIPLTAAAAADAATPSAAESAAPTRSDAGRPPASTGA